MKLTRDLFLSATPTTMAKSIRSKAKRSFRAKKREDGIYAATEAARLQRLTTKLAVITSGDADEEVPQIGKEDMPGWCWLVTLGVLDPDDITAESMAALVHGNEGRGGQRHGGAAVSKSFNPIFKSTLSL